MSLISFTLLFSIVKSDPCSDYCKQFNKLPNSEYNSYQYEEERVLETKKRCKNAPQEFYINQDNNSILCPKCDWYGDRILFRTTNFCKPSSEKASRIIQFDENKVAKNAENVGINHEKASIWKRPFRGKNTGRYYNGDDYSKEYSENRNMNNSY